MASLGRIGLREGRFRTGERDLRVKGSNFQTPTFPWKLFDVWDEPVIHRCLDLAAELGCNCLRIELPAADDRAAKRFRQLLEWSNERGMWIYLFFRWRSRKGHDAAIHEKEERWVGDLAESLAGHSGLLAYDVVNEPDWVSHSAWQWAMAPDEAVHRINWLRSLVAVLHSRDPGRPVSVGMTFSHSWWQPYVARELLADVDFVDFHYYRRTYRQSSLREAIAGVRAQTDKPILVGEFGMSSEEGWSTGGEPEHSESIQATVYGEMINEILDSDILGAIQWSLCAHIDEPRPNGENEYGIIRADYTWKPAAEVYRDAFRVE